MYLTVVQADGGWNSPLRLDKAGTWLLAATMRCYSDYENWMIVQSLSKLYVLKH